VKEGEKNRVEVLSLFFVITSRFESDCEAEGVSGGSGCEEISFCFDLSHDRKKSDKILLS
jgi:hypothetical protein